MLFSPKTFQTGAKYFETELAPVLFLQGQKVCCEEGVRKIITAQNLPYHSKLPLFTHFGETKHSLVQEVWKCRNSPADTQLVSLKSV